ncbi:hypothetical protein [Halorarum halobium]|uniref:hypothetical protein n=1 Tax=Halorarum halobium TaxID=3075121 RepID=UPI0028A5EC2F|nr:hypothetical protein [Halobaculum sp. XH14]
MVTVTEFLTELGRSIVGMGEIIGLDVALADPLSLISVLVGGLFMAASVGVLGYLALGAFVRELGVNVASPGSGPRDAPPRR